VALQLIKDFFTFYEMDYSNSVFSSESNLKEDVDRRELSRKLGVRESREKPVLLQALEALKQGKMI
jgi:hypothetical protein